MNEQIWYVYQNGQQLGPFTGIQIKQMIDTKMIPQDAYLFKAGWKDWRPIEETLVEFGLVPAHSEVPESSDRRDAAPRASIAGRVIVHNNGQLVIGTGVNISSTGIFVETRDRLFTVGEQLKLSIKSDSLTRPFNVTAKVVRYNSDSRYSIGYGLHFLDLEVAVGHDIQSAVDRLNRHFERQKGNDKAAK